MKNTVQLLLLLLSLVSLFSCSTNQSNDKGVNQKMKISAKKRAQSVSHKFLVVNEAPSHAEITKWQQIHFNGITILVEEIEMGWDDMYGTNNDSIYTTISDTAYFDLWPGEWFFDKTFKIEQTEFDKIELYENVTYNMAINSNLPVDVPFCVLYDWKTYESGWNKIQLKQDDLKFLTKENELHVKIDFTLEEFKSAVKENCGIEWYNEIKDIKTVDKLRSEIFTSRYTFKIVAKNSRTGRVVKKFIVFNTPTSC